MGFQKESGGYGWVGGTENLGKDGLEKTFEKESADSSEVGLVGGSHLRMVFCGSIRHQQNLPARPRTNESNSGVGGK